MNETFILTNIAPQVGDGFNRHCAFSSSDWCSLSPLLSDWAYLENWCRTLTHSHADVFVFTVPLYLPKRDTDGKWRVSYEVIGNSPSVGVPTHFAKVVLASRPSSSSTPLISEVSTGAFVLPNIAISDDTPLTSFIARIEDVERVAGITLFSDDIKRSSKHICETSKCEVVVRRFDDAQKKGEGNPCTQELALAHPFFTLMKVFGHVSWRVRAGEFDYLLSGSRVFECI